MTIKEIGVSYAVSIAFYSIMWGIVSYFNITSPTYLVFLGWVFGMFALTIILKIYLD